MRGPRRMSSRRLRSMGRDASLSPSSPTPVESLKNWSTSPGVGGILPMAEPRLAQALERRSKRLHVRDLTRHQELQRVDRAGVLGEVDEPFVDDLGPRLGRDVAAQIDVELAGNLQVVRRPRVSLELCRLTPPPPAIAISGSASAASRLNFIGLRCRRASAPTISR